MVERWDKARGDLPANQAVMITDASNSERDQINAMAQERRAAASELGAREVGVPGKPYGLRAGDEVIFSAQLPMPGSRRVENGITGAVLDADSDRGRLTIQTHEREPREVTVDTKRFCDLDLAYARHVYKAQGITTENAEVLIGGWQTDREGAYVALSRARESTQIYVSREDLGEAGMDIGAIERLGERIRQSRAQEASIAKEVDERDTEHQARIKRNQDFDRGLGID